MRTNHSNVTEVAHIRTDLEEYGKNHESIFGQYKIWCDECCKRISYCDCPVEIKFEEKESCSQNNNS